MHAAELRSHQSLNPYESDPENEEDPAEGVIGVQHAGTTTDGAAPNLLQTSAQLIDSSANAISDQ